MLNMHFLPDEPIKTFADDHEEKDASRKDALGFAAFADQLHRAIKGAQSPFVFGVLGDWGTGKTSILHLLEARLKTENTYIPIWFDAWRYENETNILYPLLHAIQKCHKAMAPEKGPQFESAF